MISRRDACSASLVSLLAALASGVHSGTATAAAPASADAPLEHAIAELATSTRMSLELSGRRFTGPGWEFLKAESSRAHFVLLGEDHGTAEIPLLATQLVESLVPTGLQHIGLEISPPLARALDEAVRRGGLDGLHSFFRGSRGVAFYTLAEEAAFLAKARALTATRPSVIFGLDYEVGADTFIIDELYKRAPRQAQRPLADLAHASTAAWQTYDQTRDPSKIFTFAGDPELVKAVQRAWPKADYSAREMMETLERTLTINRLQAADPWSATKTRAAFNRANFIRWNDAGHGSHKTLFKFGASHMMRGLNTTGHDDLGNLVAEAASLRSSESFHILAVPVSGEQAQFDPTAWIYKPTRVETVLPSLVGPKLTTSVLDLRPFRALVASSGAWVARFIHGFDAAVFIGDATAPHVLS